MFSSHALQTSIAKQVAQKWKSKKIQKKYGGDLESYIDDSLEILLELVWKDTESHRENFLSFDNFQAFALAELAGRVKQNQERPRILKKGLRDAMVDERE